MENKKFVYNNDEHKIAIEKELRKMFFGNNPIPKVGGRDYLNTLDELMATEEIKSEDKNDIP